jgi:hypothetical protein
MSIVQELPSSGNLTRQGLVGLGWPSPFNLDLMKG